MWERLSEQLNDIGPPKNTVKKWKRIWSVYKYNNKQRLTEIMGNENQGTIIIYFQVSLQLNLFMRNKFSDDRSRVHSVLSDKTNNIQLPAANSEELKSKIVGQHPDASDNDMPVNHPEIGTHLSAPSSSVENLPVDILSLILDQLKIIIQKLDKHEGLLNDITNKNKVRSKCLQYVKIF